MPYGEYDNKTYGHSTLVLCCGLQYRYLGTASPSLFLCILSGLFSLYCQTLFSLSETADLLFNRLWDKNNLFLLNSLKKHEEKALIFPHATIV